MEINKLWETKDVGIDLLESAELIYKDLNASIVLSYYLEGVKNISTCEIKLCTTLCHRHSSESFTKSILNAYETLVKINDSIWLKELKELNKRDYDFWDLNHYAIYLDSYGLYEFIARDYEIIESNQE